MFAYPGSYHEVPAQSASIEAALRKILSQAELLLPKMEDVQAKTMGDLVDEEMQHTAKAVEEAAAKIAVCSNCLLISFNEIVWCIVPEMFKVIIIMCHLLM